MAIETVIETVITAEIVLEAGSAETVVEPVVQGEITVEAGGDETVVETVTQTELVTQNVTEMVIETIALPELITENLGPPGLTGPVSELTQQVIERFDQVQGVLFGGQGGSLSAIVAAIDTRLKNLAVSLAGDQTVGHTIRTELRADIETNHALFITQTDVFVTDLEALSTTTTLHAVEIGNNAAAIIQEATTRATSDTASATLISEVAVQAGEATASGLWKLEAIAAPIGVTVRLAALARVNNAGVYVQSGLLIDIIPIGGGLYKSRIAMLADQIVLTNGTEVNIPFVYEGGVLYLDTAVIRNLSGNQILADTIEARHLSIGSRMISLISIVFEHNDPILNRVSWTAGSVRYTNDAGVVTASTITASETATWTTGVIYIYWIKDATSFGNTTDVTTAYGEDRVVIATYAGNRNFILNYGRTIIDGFGIKTGTVTADKINVVNLEAISATLGNVIVTGSLIVDGTIITGKLDDNAVSIVGFWTGSNTAVTGDLSYTEVVSGAITTDSGDLLITVGGTMSKGGDSVTSVSTRIKVDGTVIGTYVTNASPQNGSMAAARRVAGGTGSRTISVEVGNCNSTANVPTATNVTLRVENLKK